MKLCRYLVVQIKYWLQYVDTSQENFNFANEIQLIFFWRKIFQYYFAITENYSTKLCTLLKLFSQILLILINTNNVSVKQILQSWITSVSTRDPDQIGWKWVLEHSPPIWEADKSLIFFNITNIYVDPRDLINYWW